MAGSRLRSICIIDAVDLGQSQSVWVYIVAIITGFAPVFGEGNALSKDNPLVERWASWAHRSPTFHSSSWTPRDLWVQRASQ